MNNRNFRRNRQGGAYIVTVCLMLFFLLGFIGIALDFARLFVVKTELQTAMDSCALAAAQELDRQPDALVRAANAGILAGNANGVVMQSALWNGRGRLTANNITFRDQTHAVTTAPADARYARCEHLQTATATPLLSMLAVVGQSVSFQNGADVFARAEATLAPSQASCPLPLALRPRGSAVAPDYGYTVGEWITLLDRSGNKSHLPPGEIGWANLDGSSNAAETVREVIGHCGTRVDDPLGTPGVQTAVADVWNARFGIYKNNSGPSQLQPDYTGFIYTTSTYSQGRNALPDFMLKRGLFAACGTSVQNCAQRSGMSLNSFQNLATPGANGELRQYGGNRRIAAVPVLDIATGKVMDFVCMLMLQPVPIPLNDVQLEYLGNASAPGSPCIGNGLPGGAAGPLVPVLVL